MITLAEKVRALRAEKGWTLEECARFVGCTKANMHHIENGKVTDPTRPTLKSLARLFGVSVEYLKGGAE